MADSGRNVKHRHRNKPQSIRIRAILFCLGKNETNSQLGISYRFWFVGMCKTSNSLVDQFRGLEEST